MSDRAPPPADAKPTVSVVIPNFNHAGLVRRAICSVLDQETELLELIVIDDASTDDSVSVIENALRGEPKGKLLRNTENQGVVRTLARGLEMATGDLMLFAAADDAYLPGLLSDGRTLLAKQTDAAFVTGDLILTYETDDTDRELYVTQPFGKSPCYISPAEFSALAQRRNIMLYSSSTLLRRNAVLAARGLLSELRWHADWLLLFILATRHGFCYVPRPFARVRMAKTTFSEGRRQWNEQERVLSELVGNILTCHRDVTPLMRSAALLPTYDVRFLITLLCDPMLRPYLTWLLAWRLMSYGAISRGSRIFSWETRQRFRSLFRV